MKSIIKTYQEEIRIPLLRRTLDESIDNLIEIFYQRENNQKNSFDYYELDIKAQREVNKINTLLNKYGERLI